MLDAGDVTSVRAELVVVVVVGISTTSNIDDGVAVCGLKGVVNPFTDDANCATTNKVAVVENFIFLGQKSPIQDPNYVP